MVTASRAARRHQRGVLPAPRAGRDQHPSEQVLDNIARALRLDTDAEIGGLSLRSDRFRTLWARQDVRQKTSGTTLLLHPQVGPLDLQYEKLALPGTSGQMLITYHAERDSPSYERLQLLSHLAENPAE
ncbi:hypothetical protein [Amycolatopsis sp.]|jgi:hypothetical protein|uniref:MmyB family transcriptional regulator n=1 Tax=Amycolatopsis sp. TaxID=37632 RepID=UPI002E042258|nr:hypothetical protein [Amycolatopsis sp.]